MNATLSHASARAAVPEMVRRLMAVLAPLAGLVATAFLHRPGLVGMIGPVWLRLMHVGRRIAAVRFSTAKRRSRAGEVRPDAKPGGPEPDTAKARARLAGRKGWLVRELGYQGRAYASQLAYVLDDPEMRAVIDAAPGFGRILRPVCWMLGISREKATAAAELVAVKLDAEGSPVVRKAARPARVQPIVVLPPPVEPVPRMTTQMAWGFAKMR